MHCVSGRHKAENITSERPGEIITASVQGLSWKMERKRTRLGQSKRNGNLKKFFLLVFAWEKQEKTPMCYFGSTRIAF